MRCANPTARSGSGAAGSRGWSTSEWPGTARSSTSGGRRGRGHRSPSIGVVTGTKNAFMPAMSDKWVSAVAISPSRTVQTVPRCSSRRDQGGVLSVVPAFVSFAIVTRRYGPGRQQRWNRLSSPALNQPGQRSRGGSRRSCQSSWRTEDPGTRRDKLSVAPKPKGSADVGSAAQSGSSMDRISGLVEDKNLQFDCAAMPFACERVTGIGPTHSAWEW